MSSHDAPMRLAAPSGGSMMYKEAMPKPCPASKPVRSTGSTVVAGLGFALTLGTASGCTRPEPEVVAGCFAALELEASAFATKSGGSELYVWPIGGNAGDDLLERLGFAGHLLAMPGPSAQTALAASARVRLTGRVVKVYPSGIERHVGRKREHELAEAVVDGRSYVVHATPGDDSWNAALPSRCRAQAK